MSKLIVTGPGGVLVADHILDDKTAQLLYAFAQNYESSVGAQYEMVRNLSLADWVEGLQVELNFIKGQMSEDNMYRLRMVAANAFACIITHLKNLQQ